MADRESLEHVESIVDELAKAEGFDRPQIFIAEDISRFDQVAGADSNCKISESAGDAVTDSENDTDGGVVAGCAGKQMTAHWRSSQQSAGICP